MKPGTRSGSRVESALLQIWYGKAHPGFLIRIGLGSLELIYKALRFLSRQSQRQTKSKRPTRPPVLVVGNLIAGGTGKTPVVMAVCQHVLGKGKKAGIVSRGYGRSGAGTLLIDPAKPPPEASEVGDEPLFLSRETRCPVAVDADRTRAVEALLAAFPDLDLIVSDDGLQHHRLARQIEWVVFDSRAHGNGRLLPAGPLREPLSRLNSVDAVLCSNLSTDELSAALDWPRGQNWHALNITLTDFRQLSTGHRMSVGQALAVWQHRSVLAFTGIANPNKLFDALRGAGIPLDNTLGLPDHATYPDDFCDHLNQQVLITSGKDAVKLNPSNPRVWVAEIHVELPPALTQALEDCIGLTTD